MTEIEYKGYSFRQGDYSDKYEIFSSDEVRVWYGREKPKMSILDAHRAIEQYLAVKDALREVRIW